MIVQVPGNLLLFGEYAVTVPEGKGIGVAIDTWVTISSQKAVQMTIANKTPLVDCIVDEVSKYVKLIPAHIKIDSSDFFYEDGRKKGFGSSAAVTVGLTYLLLHQAKKQAPDILNEVFPLALKIHRHFQGGRGSGYDIAASLFGGIGLFKGGFLPTWENIKITLPPLSLVKGADEVSSKNAIALFNTFRNSHPAEAEQFIHDSNELVEKILAQNLTSENLEKGIYLNHWIHKKLGLSSESPTFKGVICKPLGAGGELAATFANNKDLLQISAEGLKCTL